MVAYWMARLVGEMVLACVGGVWLAQAGGLALVLWRSGRGGGGTWWVTALAWSVPVGLAVAGVWAMRVVWMVAAQ